MKTCECVLALVEKIKFFTDEVKTNTKFHITIGHQTALGNIHLFSTDEPSNITFNKGSLKNNENELKFEYDR